MLAQRENVSADFRRLAAMLREVQRSAIVLRAENVADCENDLSEIAAQLEVLRKTLGADPSAACLFRENPVVRQTLEQIQQTAGHLKVLFEHGANYCAGLLQTRMGTGYSEQGGAVLLPGEPRSLFEG